MSITLVATIAGADQTGFTGPIFDLVEDTPPKITAVQQVVTGENAGTFPAGLAYHSVSSPFTVTIERPAQFKMLSPVNPVTGLLASVPRNVYKLRTRKGVVPLSGQSSVTMVIETSISVPAGADTADLDNIRAALSVHFGAGDRYSDEIGDMMGDGVL